MHLNETTVMGALTRRPEIRINEESQSVFAAFTLAGERYSYSPAGELKTAAFYRHIEVIGLMKEAMSQLDQGHVVQVSGPLFTPHKRPAQAPRAAL